MGSDEIDRRGCRRGSKAIDSKSSSRGCGRGCPTTDVSPPETKELANKHAVSVYGTGIRLHNACQDGRVAGALASGVNTQDLRDPWYAIQIDEGEEDQVNGGELVLEENGSNSVNDPPIEPIRKKPPSHDSENRPVAPVYERGLNRGRVAPFISSEDLRITQTIPPSTSNRNQHRGFRKDYKLGDTVRSPSHMIMYPSGERAHQAVNSLGEYDFAFLKRSDGSFSYAILAYRSVEPIQRGDKSSLVKCMTFVTSDAGSTKMVSKNNWGKYVRLVSMQGLPRKMQFPVGTISCDMQMEDEYSMISNVSEQIRAQRRH